MATASLMTAVDFNDVSELRNTLINRAELTYFRASVDGLDYDEFANPNFITAYYRDAQGRLQTILDRPFRESLGNPAVQEFLGGNPEMEGDEVFYRNRFSVHLQGIVNAEFVEPTIYLRTVPFQFDPSRVVIRGPGAEARPMRADVTFTRVQ